MKRPQFSLRLMMLVVALTATIFGWLAARPQLQRIDRAGQCTDHELTLKYLENYDAKLDDEIRFFGELQNNDPSAGTAKTEKLNQKASLQNRIAELKNKINDLSK